MEYPGEVRRYLNEIDVYGLCSGLDMSPHSILEAGMMKKPIIASNVGGIPELILDNETGYLVDIGDTNKWIKKIQLSLEEKSGSRIGENANKFVKKNFSWKKIAKDFVNITKLYM